MTATLQTGSVVKARFTHWRYPWPVEHQSLRGKKRMITAVTVAEIISEDEKVVFAVGKGRCSVDNTFSYHAGREVALKHALELHRSEKDEEKDPRRPFNREDTGRILAAYFTRRRTNSQKVNHEPINHE